MDFPEQQKRKKHPKDGLNILAKIFFLYTIELYRKGYRKDLQESDLYQVPSEFRAKELGDKLEQEWEKQKRTHKSQSIVRLLFTCYGVPYLLLGVMQLFKDIAETIIPPYAIGKLVSYFAVGQKDLTLKDAYFYTAVLLGFTILEKIWRSNYFILLANLGIKLRSAFSSLLYRKALKLSPRHFGNISVGNILTLITKDVNTFDYFLEFGNDLWVGPLKAIVISIVLYKRVGIAAFIGFCSFVVIIPLQIYIGSQITALKMQMCKKSDDRLHCTHETLSAIRIIKMYTWEKFFTNKIFDARKKEVYSTYKIFFLKFVVHTLGYLNAYLAFSILMIAYVWLGNTVTAEIVYFIKVSFDNISYGLAFFLPLGIFLGAEVKSAINRMGIVLKAQELETTETENKTGNNPSVNLSSVSIKLGGQQILRGINLDIRSQGLTLITGPVGSGKSILLKTILQDYQPDQGTLTVEGTISYASQEPWLFPSTIRQNILFGQPYDEKRYQEVLRVCALVFDLELLVDGDNTIVEDRGANLSKGQQARINLARAVYKDCDIYVLDDPLASLDIQVRIYIFQECIKTFLTDKIVILVTNDATYIKNADKTVALENGEMQLMKSFSEHNQINTLSEKNKKVKNDKNYEQEEPTDENTTLLHQVSTVKKVYQESKKSGRIDKNVYKKYIQHSGGVSMMILVIGVFVIAQFGFSFIEKLTSNWVDLEEKIFNMKSLNSTNSTVSEQYIGLQEERSGLLILYGFILLLLFVSTIGRTIMLVVATRKASIRLHKVMIRSIVNASMYFFDKNFIGNILNRFSKDLTAVDEAIPLEIDYGVEVILYLGGAVILIATVQTMFIIPTVIFFGILFLVEEFCIRTVRNLKRLDALIRSPVVGYMNATLDGLTTIRVLKTETILKNEFDRHQDLYNSATFSLRSNSRAFSLTLDVLCVFFIGVIILKLLIGKDNSSAGDVGLAISQAFYLASTLQWAFREWMEIENHMTSVERILEYTEVTQENKQGLELDNWPSQGKIQYENVYLTYTCSDKYVLKNINFSVLPNEKIGIIGRTGAGKSSIISTLFRLYEAEGKITVDDVDTKTLSLEFLRSKISIIPQDPVLFSGTVRDNIDPLRKRSDEEIWKAIEAAHLTDLVLSLDTAIVGGGSNFSIGQKQLICIARAILRKNKIIVLDEATASMDSATDALIHQTVLENFVNCTVLVVTHKLDRIFNYCDKVLVLDKGEILEYGQPLHLLQNKNSKFFSMVRSAELSVSNK